MATSMVATPRAYQVLRVLCSTFRVCGPQGRFFFWITIWDVMNIETKLKLSQRQGKIIGEGRVAALVFGGGFLRGISSKVAYSGYIKSNYLLYFYGFI